VEADKTKGALAELVKEWPRAERRTEQRHARPAPKVLKRCSNLPGPYSQILQYGLQEDYFNTFYSEGCGANAGARQ
jgi:hypothetical protein